MWKLFVLSDFFILLICFPQVHPSSQLKTRRQEIDLKSQINHKESVIETKQLCMDIPVFKKEFESIEKEDDYLFNSETETQFMNQQNDNQFMVNFINIFKRLFEQQQYEVNAILRENLELVLENQHKFEVLLQSQAKYSTDYLTIHDEHLNCLQNCTPVVEAPEHVCSTANKNGAFVFNITHGDFQPFYAYCRHLDVHSNWIVIQHREDGSINFNRGWHDYKYGFGDVYGEYWIGLERLHALTKAQDYKLYIYLEEFSGSNRNAAYSKFFVGSENEDYMLTLGTYSGNAGDSFGQHNTTKFLTHDRTNFKKQWNCAQKFKGGWWYHDCYNCNLNGQYFSLSDKNAYDGVRWNHWRSDSLKRVTMLIRSL